MKFDFIKEKGKVVEDVVWVHVTEAKDDEVLRVDGRLSLVIGAGERDMMTRRKLVLLARRIVAMALLRKIEKIGIVFDEFRFEQVGLPEKELAELLAVNFVMAAYQHVEHKTEPKEGWPEVKEVVVMNGDIKAIREGFVRGALIGAETNNCRRLANMPGGDVIPQTLADEAKRAAKGTKIKVKVLDVPQMKKLKMGGMLGVGKGSDAPPKFIIMEYFGATVAHERRGKPSDGGKVVSKKDKPIVLVGKGVTFDTGGINLKPTNSISGMNMDMSGGAAVIHVIAIAAKLGVKKNIIALIPAVENMPSGSSYRPGDVLRSMSGKTIEVLNTDAEGRIILADALTYAKRYTPQLVVDVATLTGAAEVALGQRASALFTGTHELEDQFRAWGEESGDYVWPLPLWDEYEEDIQGFFGDWANTGTGKTKGGGAITAAVFLKQFAEGYPWVHIDIAPRMTAIEGEFLARGAAGAPVRLLVRMLEKM